MSGDGVALLAEASRGRGLAVGGRKVISATFAVGLIGASVVACSTGGSGDDLWGLDVLAREPMAQGDPGEEIVLVADPAGRTELAIADLDLPDGWRPGPAPSGSGSGAESWAAFSVERQYDDASQLVAWVGPADEAPPYVAASSVWDDVSAADLSGISAVVIVRRW